MKTISEQEIINRISRENKTREIRIALERGESLTGLDILDRFGVYRASSVIHKLRAKGLNIKTSIDKGSKGETYARYYI